MANFSSNAVNYISLGSCLQDLFASGFINEAKENQLIRQANKLRKAEELKASRL